MIIISSSSSSMIMFVRFSLAPSIPMKSWR